MQAPDMQEHIAVRYQALGFSPIPLETGGKRPHEGLLPGRQWAPYQAQPAARAVVATWTQMNPEPNWGLVCGQVSHGLYCGDCDDVRFAQWVLAHARDPLLRGACIVKSGSGKAHIWFLSPTRLESHVWKPRQGNKVGDVRGDGRPGALGSYMVVPPSIHPDTGQPYTVVAGSFDSLPMIDNGDAFLAEILAAYRQEVPDSTPPVSPTSRAVLTLSPEERLRVQTHVVDLKLKQKIKDTLLVKGNQAPGSRHWMMIQDDSRSGIDYAVVCELIRKGQTFDQVEEIFAATEIGNNRYLAKNIKHSTGYAYLKTTYDNALREVEEQRRQSRVAKGQNFEVTEVTRTRHARDLVVYSIQVQFTLPNRDPFLKTVVVPSDVLGMEDRFTRAVFDQTGVHPLLNTNHRGKHNYPSFMQAVSDMVVEDQQVPVAVTKEGHFASELWAWMQTMQPRLESPTLGEASALGWRIGDTYYLRLREVFHKLQSQRAEFHFEDLTPVLSVLGEPGMYSHYWPETGYSETLVTVTRASSARPRLPALPAPS